MDLENQKISEDKIGDVAGGFDIDVVIPTEGLGSADTLYVDEEEYGALLGSGLVGKDRKLYEHDVKKVMEVLFSTNGYNSLKLDSPEGFAKAFSKMPSITRVKKSREIRIDLVR